MTSCTRRAPSARRPSPSSTTRNSTGSPLTGPTGGASANPLPWTYRRSPSSVEMNPWSFSSLNQISVPRIPESAQPVDDPAAVEVVRRELDLDAVARIDADPVALHPPGHVAERLVSVVEVDAIHPVPERLRDLALQLDLFFFLGDRSLLSSVRAVAAGAATALQRNVSRLRRRSSPRDPSYPRGPRTRPWHPR